MMHFTSFGDVKFGGALTLSRRHFAQPNDRTSARDAEALRCYEPQMLSKIHFVYRCPVTGLIVDAQMADDSRSKDAETYWL